MNTATIDISQQLHDLQCQLDELRLQKTEQAFKTQREQIVLTRTLVTMSQINEGQHPQLTHILRLFRSEIEQKKDISQLIPRLAVLNRMLKQHDQMTQHQFQNLSKQVQQNCDLLQGLPTLPDEIKSDLKQFTTLDAHSERSEQLDNSILLLNIYERAFNLLTTNDGQLQTTSDNTPTKEQLIQIASDLQYLITSLNFEGEYGDLLFKVRAKLLLGVDAKTLYELTLKVLTIAIEESQHDRKASGQFIEHLSHSLAVTLKTTEQNLAHEQNYQLHRQQINNELSSVIKNTKLSLTNASSISELQHDIAPMLNQLHSLSERLQHTSKREELLIERMQHGKVQLESLVESTNVQQQVLDKQNRRLLLDPLTQVYNRTTFLDRLELEYQRKVRSQHSLQLAIFDIDNFKSINERFGYAAGDKALKIIARNIKNTLTQTDMVARFSSDEFILLLPEHDTNESQQLIERIQAEISQLPFKFRDEQIAITLSVACSAFSNSDTPTTVLERLEQDLQQVKKTAQAN